MPRGGMAAHVRSAGGRAAVCGAPAGRVPYTVRAFVLGLGAARHRGIVELSTSEGTVVRCVAVFACFSHLLT